MKLQLVITPDGRSLLTTPEQLSSEQGHALLEAFARWRQGHETLLLANCEVVRVLDIDLDPALEG